jgi:dTDP-4-amino-4,6-dideoxygalactose transaminase
MKSPHDPLPRPYRERQREINASVAWVLASDWCALGPDVEAFEPEWAASLDALKLALRTLDIGP